MENDLAEPRVNTDEIASICRAILGADPAGVTYPGGQDRKTVVATVAGREVVVTKRSSGSRASLEALVLRTLGGESGVPELLGHRGQFVLQSKLQGQRLSEALELGELARRKSLLVSAGTVLIELQSKANASTLLDRAPKIGVRDGWQRDFARTPERLAELIGVQDFEVDIDPIVEVLEVRLPSFVKWDSRPGNALVDTSGQVGWFDWEHCGVASAEDDLVWLLADEWSPNVPEAEFELLKLLAETREVEFNALVERFHTKAVLHSMIRLGLIFRRKGDGPWWSAKSSLENDRVGVSLAHVRRVVARADRWASSHAHLRDLRGVLIATLAYAETL